MSTERDTHFQRFAQLLWQEIDGEFPDSVHTEMFYAVDDFEANIVQIIAQRAYDLALHAFASVDAAHRAEYGDPSDCVEHVPDLTKWPDNTHE